MSAGSRSAYVAMGDRELLERFYATRDNAWLGELLSRYTLLLLGVCMKYLRNEDAARDAVQQVFLKAITELEKYRVEYPKSWLYMIARNHCLMIIRDRHGVIPEELRESIQPAAEGPSPEVKEKEARLLLMESSLEQLSQEQRTCITSFYLERKSYQRISEETRYTVPQVKSYIQNGKRNLRIIMERKSKGQ